MKAKWGTTVRLTVFLILFFKIPLFEEYASEISKISG